MLKSALAIFLIGGASLWGQTRNDPPKNIEKVDRAAAYYHYMLAHMYAEMAATSLDRNQEYAAKADENYKAAIKADSQTPMLNEEYRKGLGRRFPFVFRPVSPK